jgi:hypothetical protein
VYLTCPYGFQIRSGVEATSEQYGQLIAGCNPFLDISTALIKIADGEKDQSSGFLREWKYECQRAQRTEDSGVFVLLAVGP